MFFELKKRILPALQIVGLCILGSVLYGIAHDMVTAHVAVEYFTVWHPHIVDSESPVVMALVWGVLATWWMGAFFGGMLSIAARAGELPKLVWRDFVSPLSLTLVGAWLLAMLIGIGFYLYARYAPGASGDSHEYERRLVVVGTVHAASYALTALGGIVLTVWTVLRRRRLAQAAGGL